MIEKCSIHKCFIGKDGCKKCKEIIPINNILEKSKPVKAIKQLKQKEQVVEQKQVKESDADKFNRLYKTMANVKKELSSFTNYCGNIKLRAEEIFLIDNNEKDKKELKDFYPKIGDNGRIEFEKFSISNSIREIELTDFTKNVFRKKLEQLKKKIDLSCYEFVKPKLITMAWEHTLGTISINVEEEINKIKEENRKATQSFNSLTEQLNTIKEEIRKLENEILKNI